MKRSHKIATGIALSLTLGLAAAAYARQDEMGGGMGPRAKDGAQRGMMGGMGPGAMDQGRAGQGSAHSLMTPEERTALMEKMHNAATPEERQKIAAANRAEMQKRAQERGITLRGHHGPRAGAASPAPATTEQAR